MDVADLETALGPAEPKFRARQIYDAVYRRRAARLEEISNLPKHLRARLAEELPLGLPEIQAHFDSVDGTRRYLLKLADAKTVAAVSMPEERRSTVCVSGW